MTNHVNIREAKLLEALEKTEANLIETQRLLKNEKYLGEQEQFSLRSRLAKSDAENIKLRSVLKEAKEKAARLGVSVKYGEEPKETLAALAEMIGCIDAAFEE